MEKDRGIKITNVDSDKQCSIGVVIWRLSLVMLIPIMFFILVIIRPILKRHYEPKWITKWYKKTGSKIFY